mmetsp:Transcript_27116/g.75796  ORF Transcript_27116/g.75796 Transcript_27116/m.75796 type:complete len:286 (-) Transcript_27116:340-1197(-)
MRTRGQRNVHLAGGLVRAPLLARRGRGDGAGDNADATGDAVPRRRGRGPRRGQDRGGQVVPGGDEATRADTRATVQDDGPERAVLPEFAVRNRLVEDEGRAVHRPEAGQGLGELRDAIHGVDKRGRAISVDGENVPHHAAGSLHCAHGPRTGLRFADARDGVHHDTPQLGRQLAVLQEALEAFALIRAQCAHQLVGEPQHVLFPPALLDVPGGGVGRQKVRREAELKKVSQFALFHQSQDLGLEDVGLGRRYDVERLVQRNVRSANDLEVDVAGDARVQQGVDER